MENQLFRVAGIHGLMLVGFNLIAALGSYLVGTSSAFIPFLAIIGFLGLFIQLILIIRAQLQYQKIDYDMSYGQAMLIGLIVAAIGFIASTATSMFMASSVSGLYSGDMMLWSYLFSTVISLFYILFGTMITGMWRLFEKAGKPGWATLVPFYNLIVMCEIGKKPTWWVVLCLIPLVNIVFIVMIYNGLSKAFGKDEGWTVGLVLLGVVFFPLLAFGANYYQYEHIEGENPNDKKDIDGDLTDHLVT